MFSRQRRRIVLGAAALAACGEANPTGTMAEGDTFPSGSVRLGYTLDLPAGSGPFPAFVLGHGSGRSTRDEGRGLAGRLVAEGYAVLRYDKRGVGASTGVYEGVSVGNSVRMIGALADDMAAGVVFLRSRPEIDGRRVGLIGASQAGWIMPVAARRVDVAWMVLLVGPTVSVGVENYYSALAEGTTTGYDEMSAQLATFAGPHGYDPRPHLEALDTPGLWILGAEDRSIPTRETVAVLQELARSGRPYRWIVYEQVGHNLGGRNVVPDVMEFLGTLR
jgi:pimeloyl-ACP methyl ester carboxylesterase